MTARTPARLTAAPGTQVPDAAPPPDMLAISAGGDGGAFAAGLLTGWSAAGTRPQFAVVTGVSAGAFIAPFAFLGPRYDGVLREITLSLGPEKLFRPRGLIAGLLGDGFASSAPLEQLLARYVTAQVLEDVAQAYRNGRDLFVLTTDLDAGTPVIWSMGAIAASGAPGSLDLFRRVILASGSIPTAVSPVLIDVAAGGRHFRELHVDGGVTHQVFLPVSASCAEGCRVFIIMNMHLELERSATPRRLLQIGSRAVNTLLQSAARQDLELIQAGLASSGAEVRVAYMGKGFKAPHPSDFDSAYLRALFAYGVNLASSGEAWHPVTPPAPPSPRAPRPMTQAVAALDVPSAGSAPGGEPDEP